MKNSFQYLILIPSSIIIGLLYSNSNFKNVKIPDGVRFIEETHRKVKPGEYGCQLNFKAFRTSEPIIDTDSVLEELIRSMDLAWATAILEKDISQLDMLLADDLIYGHASGVLDTKLSYIEKVATGKQVYKTLELKSVRVRLLGRDAAVTHSWMHVTGTNPDGSFDDKVMMLHVWTKRKNGWMLIGHQTAKVDIFPI